MPPPPNASASLVSVLFLAELTCGVPVERQARTVDTPEQAEAWFTQLRADRWTLVEPYVADYRNERAGFVVAIVSLFRPPRIS